MIQGVKVMVYKPKSVSSMERKTYYTILMPDYDGDMVLANFKNNWDECLFTTSLFDAKKFVTEKEALDFILEELKGEVNSYRAVPLKVEVALRTQEK